MSLGTQLRRVWSRRVGGVVVDDVSVNNDGSLSFVAPSCSPGPLDLEIAVNNDADALEAFLETGRAQRRAAAGERG